MDNNNKWDELSLTEKSEIMKQAVANGITDLQDIRDNYNNTVNNYIDNIYANGTEESYGDPSDHYNNVDKEMLKQMTPDARGHYDDSVKLPNHPSSPTRGTFNGQYFDFTDKGFEDPNYTMFGLQDNGDGNAIMRYNGDIVMPELTVTPNENYYDDTYNNIKIQQGHKHDFGGPVKHDARYNHAVTIYQSFVNQGVSPQVALELTNQKIAEKGWSGWASGDNKRYGDVNSFTDHTIDQFNRLYPDSLKSNNFNQFFQGIEGGRTKYNPTPNIYRQHLLQTRPGVKKRINEYRRLQGQSPLSLVSPTSTPLPWEESILYNPQLPLEVSTEQPVIAADGGYLYARGGKLSQQNQRAGYAVNYFMNKGLSKVAAAGLVGNLMRESRMDPNALNPDIHGSAHGLAQFRGARWKNLQKMYGSNPTFEQQLDYIWHELNTTHKKGLQMLKSSKTVDEAAKNAFGYYEFSKGPENAIAQMAKYNKKMGYNQANGYKAMNDGITNAWVAYGKANPNIKLQGLNVNAPVLGYNRTIPNYDFTSAVDGLNVEDSIANFSGETPKFQYDLFPPNPTNYGKPIDYSSIKHPEKKLPETLDSTEKEDNDNMGIFSLMDALSSVGSQSEPPLTKPTPQRQSNAPFIVGISQSNSNLLDIPLMAAYGGRLYDGGGKEDIYDKSAKVGNKTYPARTMLINGKETPVFLADDNRMYAVGDDKTPFEIWSQYSLPEVTVTPSKNKDKITGDYYNNSANRYYDSSYDPNGFMDFMNTATLGLGNRLSVSQNARLVKDIYDASTGNKSWEDVVNSAVLGNEGIFENPYANMALDIVVPTVGGKYKAATGYLNRNMGYWGDNLLSRTYGTMARRWGLPTTSKIPETYRTIKSIPDVTADGKISLYPTARSNARAAQLGEEVPGGHANFSTDRKVTGHGSKAWQGDDVWIVKGENLINENTKGAFRSVEPSDMFTEGMPVENRSFNPKDLTVVTGNPETISWANEHGVNVMTDSKLQELYEKSLADESNIFARDDFSAYEKYQRQLMAKRGRPTKGDYKKLEELTGLPTGTASKNVEEETMSALKKQQEAGSTTTSLTYPNNRVIGSINKAQRYNAEGDYGNVYYDPATDIEYLYKKWKADPMGIADKYKEQLKLYLDKWEKSSANSHADGGPLESDEDSLLAPIIRYK